jgi:FkbM family methyltransferase
MEADSLAIRFGNFLYHRWFSLYNLLYEVFKRRQDAPELRLLRRLVRPGDIILDIGANIGFYSRLLSTLAGPSGKVYSFEPDDTNFIHLLTNIRGLLNVEPIKKAVAESSGFLKLYTSPMLNVDHRTYKVDDYAEEQDIAATSVDDFVEGRFRVNLIKIDIQGFEVFALRGMKRTLEENEDIIILAELWPYGLRKAGCSCKTMMDFLSTLGFQIFEIAGDRLVEFDVAQIPWLEEQPFGYVRNILISRKTV